MAGTARTDEGDFSGAGVMMGIGAALRFTDEGKKLSRPELVLHQHELLFDSFERSKELRNEKKKFAAAYYAAYFRELQKAHHAEAFTYYIVRQSGWPEVTEWLGKNSPKVMAYSDCSRSYQWPSDLKVRK